jgi:excinuclease ABC subunit C
VLENPQNFIRSLPNKPGVYQMFAVNNKLLYVGKAKNLKARLSSYFYAVKDPKTVAFMAQVRDIKIIITANENEALLLESNLIKMFKPHYNILFKDDKSFPYLLLSNHEFPRLSVYRGVVAEDLGKFFGPFPCAKAVSFTFDLLQKIFRLRVCKDSYLGNRTRPCMLYQINRCVAPCVKRISKEAYDAQVKMVENFLRNKNTEIVKKLIKLMDDAANNLAYEQASIYRDQIASIRKIQSQQAVIKGKKNIDVLCLVVKNMSICINILFIRNGMLLGNNSYFQEMNKLNLSFGGILTAFVMQHYLQSDNALVIPDKIITNIKPDNYLGVAFLLREKCKRKIIISSHASGVYKSLVAMSEVNAINSLRMRVIGFAGYSARLEDFKNTFQLEFLPARIECFDISHHSGEAPIGVCVVFTASGPCKKNYRKFNITAKILGDDYGAMREVLLRRYGDLKDLPDVIIIDGGRGQLSVAAEVLKSLNINNIFLISIAKSAKSAKSSDDNVLEKIYVHKQEKAIILQPQSLALQLVQQIRDETHRFAISGHRLKMRKTRTRSVLGNISGIGKSKQIILLKKFGGLTELKSAGINDIAKTKGIGRNLAQKIYDYLHAE